MPWGKYKNLSFIDIHNKNENYLPWIVDFTEGKQHLQYLNDSINKFLNPNYKREYKPCVLRNDWTQDCPWDK